MEVGCAASGENKRGAPAREKGSQKIEDGTKRGERECLLPNLSICKTGLVSGELCR